MCLSSFSWPLNAVLPVIRFPMETSLPTTFFGFAGWLGSGFLSRSTTHTLHDLGKPIAGVGKAIDVVLALATAVNDSTVPQQSQVVADSRLAEVELLA